jgi:hypothetical protein
LLLIAASRGSRNIDKEQNMGKYLIGWILGVPAIVLVVIYLVFN